MTDLEVMERDIDDLLCRVEILERAYAEPLHTPRHTPTHIACLGLIAAIVFAMGVLV